VCSLAGDIGEVILVGIHTDVRSREGISCGEFLLMLSKSLCESVDGWEGPGGFGLFYRCAGGSAISRIDTIVS